jgi:hypothetical protein
MAGFEPGIVKNKRLQTHAFDRAATGGSLNAIQKNFVLQKAKIILFSIIYSYFVITNRAEMYTVINL